MMDLKTFKTTIKERQLRIGEVLSIGYSLLSQRFGRYLILSFLVYLPINLIVQWTSASVVIPEEVDIAQMMTDTYMNSLLNSMARMIVVEVTMLFLELMAILVVAVTVKNQLYDEENKSFGVLFYRGIRMWPRGALTTILILIGAVVALMCASIMVVLPLVQIIAIPLIFVILFYLVMYLDLSGVCAALTGRFGFQNLRYLGYLLSPNIVTVSAEEYPFFQQHGLPYDMPKATFQMQQPVRGRALRTFIVLTLLSYGISFVVTFLGSGILTFFSNQWVNYGISVLIATMFSVFNIFTFICATLVYYNLEEMKRKLEVDRQSKSDV